MERSTDEQFLHDWVIRQINGKYARTYSDVHINPGTEKNFEHMGKYPDAVFVNYEQVVQVVEVETKETINEGRVGKWKELSELGVKLSLLVPKDMQGVTRDLCFNNGLAAKVNIGSFDVQLNI